MPKRALFVGRFQPFHNGHFQVIKKLLSSYDEVIIVVGSAEDSISFNNPFTAGERIEMIRSCFTLNELSKVLIIPLRDINNNSLWVSHVISHVPEFHSVYSNNWLVKLLFSKAGVKTEKINFFNRKQCEGKKIRALMAVGKKNWSQNIPQNVMMIIKRIGGIERVQKINSRSF